ncbi:hypothetical protein ABKN59_006648 [Abortiporus biennis]
MEMTHCIPSTSTMEVDDHLAHLLETMSLANAAWLNKPSSSSSCPHSHSDMAREDPVGATITILSDLKAHPDASMSDSSDSEDSIFTPPSPSASSSTTIESVHSPQLFGCGLLQYIQTLLLLPSSNNHNQTYSTTNGEYLETIFTHREAFYAFPPAHRECALGFSEIAKLIERRAWRADWEGDLEAVKAFRQEAWVVANTLPM